VIESETFATAKPWLTLALGRDINSRIVTADLATMPNLLMAGSNGSGLSASLDVMILSLLFRTMPSQVRLILVPPTHVEQGIYEGIPHLLTPIVTEAKLATSVLGNAVREMESRLKLLSSRSVRNIDRYNALFKGRMGSRLSDPGEEQPLPYLVIIIEELAELMMVDQANVEDSVVRLTAMGRPVGIHLILATQHPAVIADPIKSAIPTRISFLVATKEDSQVILDSDGAETLLGHGDMLFRAPGTKLLIRLHAPCVSEKETAAVANFWKEQGTARYDTGFLNSP